MGDGPEAKWTFAGGSGEGTLEAAITAAASVSGDIEIQLLSDIELDDSWNMPVLGNGNEVTLVGDGHTISRGDCKTGLFEVNVSDTHVILGNITLDGGAVWSEVSPKDRTNSGISVNADASLIRVGGAMATNVKVTLEQGAVLKNNSLEQGDFNGAGVQILANGILEMQEGSAIKDNATPKSSNGRGGGVYVGTGGVFMMTGGIISGNYSNKTGGGVHVEKDGGIFLMKDGQINGNYGNAGGGIYVAGKLIMEGGSIFQNNALDNGGGITATSGSDATLYGGTIYENSADYGGGISVYTDVNVGGSICVKDNKGSNGSDPNNVLFVLSDTKLVLGMPLSDGACLSVAKAGGASEGYTALAAGGEVSEADITDALAFIESEDSKMKYLKQDGDKLVFTKDFPGYTVTFRSNGGSDVAPETGVPDGNLLTKPADPKRSGYTFAGWFKDSDLMDPWNFESETVTKNLILYAKWNRAYIPSYYQVTFDSQGGTPVEGYFSVREYTTIQEPVAPTYDGYTFLGWYRDPAGETPWDFTKDIVNGNLTLYAKWEALPLPGDMDLKLVQKTTDTVTLSWDPVENAEGYSLWYKAEGQEKYELAKLITGTDTFQWMLTDLKPGTKYYFRGKAWRQFGTKRAYGGSVRAIRGTTYPETAVIKSVTADRKGRLKVRLAEAAAGAERYAFCYSKKASFVPYRIGIRTSYTVRTMPDELSPGTYWVKARSYRMLDGKCYYGDWSEAVEATVTRK